jgi:hypothetical protein
MRTIHALIIGVAIVVATAIASAAAMIGGRYTIITISGNNVAWKLDRWTGQAYGCEESEFGPFCIPAPDRIKHTQ